MERNRSWEKPARGLNEPRLMEKFATGTQSLDLSSVFSGDVTASGSFDVRGIQKTFLGKLLDSLPIPALLIDPSHSIVFVNAGSKKIFEDPDDMLFSGLEDIFVHRKDAERCANLVARVLEDRKQQITEAAVGTVKEPIWGRLHFRSLRMGHERSILVLIEDLTPEKKKVYLVKKYSEELRKAHDELEMRVRERTAELREANVQLQREIDVRRQAEESLNLAANVVSSSNEAIVITDSDARIVDVNDAFVRVTGYSREEVIGKDPAMMASGRHDVHFWNQFWDSLLMTGQWKGEVWDRRKNGEIYPKLLSVSAVRNDDDRVSHYVGIFSDISKMKETEARLEQLAHYDPLTGLPNRVLFRDRLSQAMLRVHRAGGPLALMFLDLDGFKIINDTLGHQVGDMLLVAVGHRLQSSVRSGDTVARLGGDEFTIVLSDLEDVQNLSRLARRTINLFSKPFNIAGRKLFVTASIGIALYPHDGRNVDQLLQSADTAMFSAKDRGKNGFQYFSQEMNLEAMNRLNLETSLREALDRDEFELYYQPLISLESRRVVGAEALLRWKNPERGTLLPGTFVPLAETIGLIRSIGSWALAEACRQAKTWIADGLPRMFVAVNMSAHQIRGSRTVKLVSKALEATGLDPELLELEVTESALMKEADQTVKTLKDLKNLGIRLSIDDFGTGYSSLSQLKRFPVDKLKVDQSFIADIARDSDTEAIVRTIIAIGHTLRLSVVAEGVENRRQTEFLEDAGCDLAQGFYYGRPLPSDQFTRFVKRHTLTHG